VAAGDRKRPDATLPVLAYVRAGGSVCGST